MEKFCFNTKPYVSHDDVVKNLHMMLTAHRDNVKLGFYTTPEIDEEQD